MRTIRLKSYLKPVLIVFVFNVVTLVWFFTGAWEYKIVNPAAVVAIVLSCNFALFLGYFVTIYNHKRNHYNELLPIVRSSSNKKHIIKILWRWTIVAALFALPETLYYSRMWNMSFNEILNRLSIAFTQSSLNYSYSLSYQDSGSVIERIVVLVFVLLYFFKFAVLPLTIFYWRDVSKKQKALCVYITIMDIAKWLLKGMNKGLFDVVIVFFAALLVLFLVQKCSTTKKHFSNRRLILLVFSIGIVFFALTVFISNIRSRVGTNDSALSYYSSSMGLYADKDSLFLRLLPKQLHGAYLSLEMYLTNGYQGLSYASDVQFNWCYGLGNNQFLISNFRDLGIDVSKSSYLYTIETCYPWAEAHNWHTLYTWLANDTSFYFLPLLFAFYGWLFAKSFIDSVEEKNPYAMLVFCMLFIRFAYSSANNQLTSSSFTFVAWYLSLFMWAASKKRYSVCITLQQKRI